MEDLDRVVIDEIARAYMGAEHYPFDPPDAERVTMIVHAEQVSAPRIFLDDDPPTAPDRRTD